MSSKKLGQWEATAICGNDITSSCLYVSALSLLWAGPMAPVALIMVAAVLWLFRGIYAEVIGALPLNGGAYNALLNTTSKARASVAACLTILSYLATAVISASEAVHYGSDFLDHLFPFAPNAVGLYVGTVGLLLLFAILTIRGLGESAKVALGIFIFHIASLSLLVVTAFLWVSFHGWDIFLENLNTPPPYKSSFPLFFGFAVAMLGISGFESSANFVEEQEDGVFPKTLRNMWIAVSFFNPVICLLALMIIPLGHVAGHQTALLSELGAQSGGSWLSLLISFDAAIVLSGAVLTSYVGTTGLVHRMTLDRCLPQALLKRSRHGTFSRIILSFFVLCALLLAIAKDLDNLAGVYTISFLSVMALFVFGNMLLKVKRARLPRPTRASWVTLLFALVAVTVGLLGNILVDVKYIQIFFMYFIPALLIVTSMLTRSTILMGGIYFIRTLNARIGSMNAVLTRFMKRKLQQVQAQEIVFFTRGDNLANLNQAVLYVRENEHTKRIRLVTIVKSESEVPDSLKQDVDFLNRAYPEIDISLEVIEGHFTPELLKELSDKWHIPLNFMFIGSPGDHFPHQISELGGVRLII